jgi:thiosulfate dehydrogenase
MRILPSIVVYFIAINALANLLCCRFSGKKENDSMAMIDVSKMPEGKFGEEVKYGRMLMMQTAKYIGPEGLAGKWLGNNMNCTNCHQDGGIKGYSFNLILSHEKYPQYRAREAKVLTLAERVNNCIERPLNGKPLPLDGREMVAILCYLKWINSIAGKSENLEGSQNLEIKFPVRATNSERGGKLFMLHCQRCHGATGDGQLEPDSQLYLYPPIWGEKSYQRGSSMHRVIKLAQWLKANMPYDKATWNRPFLSDEEALDIAAFINDDQIHKRPGTSNSDYPHP